MNVSVLLAVTGLIVAVIGSLQLVVAGMTQSDKHAIQVASSYWGANPHVLRSEISRRALSNSGALLLGIGFLCQLSSYGVQTIPGWNPSVSTKWLFLEPPVMLACLAGWWAVTKFWIPNHQAKAFAYLYADKAKSAQIPSSRELGAMGANLGITSQTDGESDTDYWERVKQRIQSLVQQEYA